MYTYGFQALMSCGSNDEKWLLRGPSNRPEPRSLLCKVSNRLPSLMYCQITH